MVFRVYFLLILLSALANNAPGAESAIVTTPGLKGGTTVGGVAEKIARQQDGRLVVAGFCGPNPWDMCVTRLSIDGSLDSTFGDGGLVSASFDGEWQTKGLFIQSDGRILVAGRLNHTNGGVTFALLRLNSDGSYDQTFGYDGMVIGSRNAAFRESIEGFAVDAHGSIVTVGMTSDGSRVFILIQRFKPNGLVDRKFGHNGKLIRDFGGGNGVWSAGSSVLIQPDGKYIIAGNYGTAIFGVLRLYPSGALDTTFVVTGRRLVVFPGGNGVLQTTALQPDGKILLGGYTWTSSQQRRALVRLNPNGTSDSTFGSDGIVLGTGGPARSIGIQSDGMILVPGYSGDYPVVSGTVHRYSSTGGIDILYGNRGVATLNPLNPFMPAELTSVVIQPDGYACLAGVSWNPQVANSNKFAVFRLDQTGMIDKKFTYQP